MYIPAAFNETDLNKLFEFIEQHSFGILVSQHGGAPFASHLPFLTDRNAGPKGQLIGHMARANPHWTQAEGQSVVCVFSGPHAYISPTWYEAANAVPTWNYAAVHVTGKFQAIHDPEELLHILTRTVNVYESRQAVPWQFDTSNEFYKKLALSIVGFRIQIDNIEGKWKLNQNRPLEQREKVVRALQQSASPDDLAIAEMMKLNILANNAARDSA